MAPLIREVTGPALPGNSGFGNSVSGGGHLDTDGIPDQLVGAPDESALYGISGADGSTLFRIEGSNPPPFSDSMGWAVAFMGPIAGTDVDAFVVGAQRGDTGGNLSGSAYIYAADSRWRFQCWYRDPSGAGSGFNLSDALEAWFCP